MTDYRSVLEHDLRRTGPAEFTLDDVARRRERKQRDRRTAAGVFGLALTILVLGGWLTVINLAQPKTADPPGGHAVTSETGVDMLEPYGILGGEVTFRAPETWSSPWMMGVVEGEESILIGGEGTYLAVIEVQAPVPPCAASGTPATAAQLAARIESDPELIATALPLVTIGGVEALRLDVAAGEGAEICGEAPPTGVPVKGVPVVMHADGSHSWSVDRRERMRVHLLPFPTDPNRTLAILISSRAEDFDEALAAAEPILATLEFVTE
jgi:hypothetical protein